MKKIILSVSLIVAVYVAHAEYLIWQVDSGAYTEESYTHAGISVYDHSAGLVYVDTLDMTKVPTGQMNTPLSSPATEFNYNYTGGNYTYFIELFSYDGSTHDYSVVAHSETGFTYQDLVINNHLSTSMQNLDAMTATWAGVPYKAGAAPEPTSGLLTMIGLALLGLKRRRV